MTGPTTDRTQYDKDRADQKAAADKLEAEMAVKASTEAAIVAQQALGKTREEAEAIVKQDMEAAQLEAQQTAQQAQEAQQAQTAQQSQGTQ
jgi:hypothetical protein